MSNEQGRYYHFVLKITIPDVDKFTIPQFENEFSRYSYKKDYWKNIVFPNSVDYTFGPLTDEGVKNMLEKLRVLCDQIFEKEYKKYIRYSIENIDLETNNIN